MKYLLDTNTCVYLIKRRPPQVGERFRRHRLSQVALSSIVVSELSWGAAKSGLQKNVDALDAFLAAFQVVAAYDQAAAFAYGRLRADLERRGTPIGPLDMLIAAHALSLDTTLVTNNVREFKRVPGLRVENWTAA
jgi:tRNA(fMet)-specific endonuclease VapC